MKEADGNQNEFRSREIGPFLFKLGGNQTEIDHTIWAAFKQGNFQAFNYIFEKYIRLLYSYGRKLSRDYMLVEDCIQDMFIELWRKRELLSETDNIKFYLLKSLRRKIARRQLTDQRHRIVAESVDGRDPVESSIENSMILQQASLEQQNQLNRAISKLSIRQREAVYLKFYEHITYEELASVLDIDLKSAYKLIGKAIDSLRRALRSKFK
jgi:RNA polymerase sigma-70 factor (ECF subfamily)